MVYKRSGAKWVEQGPALTGHEASHRFGESVALSADGEIALVGAPRLEAGAGAVWVFKRSGSKWSQQGPPLRTGKRVGESVALSADGEIALTSATNQGTSIAAVFERQGSRWELDQELTAGVEGTTFGSQVALSASGELALLSGASGPGGQNGVWTFKRSGSEWLQQGPVLAGSGESEKGFGASLALAANGTVALIGAPWGNEGEGAVLAFRRSGSTWIQQGPTLTGAVEGNGAGGRFGSQVAISGDGETALIGARGSVTGGPPRHSPLVQGGVWVFEWLGGAWRSVGGELSKHFGESALSENGDLALVGVRVFERAMPNGSFRSRATIAPSS